MYSFPRLVFSHWVFLARFLMRHVAMSNRECYNYKIMDITK